MSMRKLLKTAGVAGLLAFSAVSYAQASTIVECGVLANNANCTPAALNLSTDSYHIQGFANGNGSLIVDTYVDPLKPSGAVNANLLIGLAGATDVTGSWGSTIITFTKIGSSWLADAFVAFTQSGLAGKQTLTINWVGATEDGLSVDLAAVPVPPAAVLLVSGMAGLGYLGRRRQRKAAA